MLRSIESVQQAFRERQYIADRSLATIIYLSGALGKPLLLEGEAGVGKTEVAKVMAAVLDTDLIRLQCYEGLDANTALYEWNYPKQMLHIKIAEATQESKAEVEKNIFSEEFLIRRPLLEAIYGDFPQAPVLLIDEIDRCDEEFEAFLLEVLSDFQISIPEIGTIQAKHRPYVVLTSNRTREVHDALKRRCLYHWIDYPSFQKELEIVQAKVPQIREELARQLCGFMGKIRQMDFFKRPGVAETLDWAQAMLALHREALDETTLRETLGCIFKYNEDIRKFTSEVLGGKAAVQELIKEWANPKA
ncbi:MAG: MoxR family ATPase [Deltaproteobacteria bacterium]|nr:MoxR family ATPase [Deltaproteobacteria bacterium]MBI3078109.1 MoxR family ATPase [Deltaproteobacteria bacterium]